ncbi:MAG: glutamate synthase large subunit [Opitutales bacterium]
MKRLSYYPEEQGLYNPSNEHDACGVGLIADIKGKATHKILKDGMGILKRLMHRGAVGADSMTGDGAGILTQIPDAFYRKKVANLPEVGKYAVAMLFTPTDESIIEKIKRICEGIFEENSYNLITWRDLPCDKTAIGGIALDTCPNLLQFFIAPKDESIEGDALERDLYVLRRALEKAVESNLQLGDMFYVSSLSARTVIYKGLLNAPQLENFFKDLQDEDFITAIALVHQRYSTNTFPTWPLAQPFRYLAHNGEINTLKGNVNQMRMKQEHFESALLGDKIKTLLPIINENQSDSACLDNAVEFYSNTGRSLAHTMLMLVPQAWGKNFYVSKDIMGFFEYHSGVSEPWDGPAALGFTNGLQVGALLDRNGLRPARYTITKEGTFVLASETGVVEFAPEEIEQKGRLRPGEMIYIDTVKGRILFDNEIKTIIARQKPYRRWVAENRITLPGIFETAQSPTVDKHLLSRQKLFGYSREDIDIILKPMATTAYEPTGSMGNDAALSVLSDKSQLLYDYFKQLFAQVTNPPIDPIREELVMSLMTYIGNQGNSLDENPKLAHLLKLPHPILTNSDISCLKNSKIPTFQSAVITAQFSAQAGNVGMDKALEKLCEEALAAVKDNKSVIIISDKNLDYGYAPIPMLLAVSAVNAYLSKHSMRTHAGIVAETGEAREIMHFALLLGYGATAINPYLALESVVDLIERENLEIDPARAVENYVKASCKGLLKVMSKMGISTLRSYRQAQVFEAIGLKDEFVQAYFKGTASRIGGIGIEEVTQEALMRYKQAHYPIFGEENLLENKGKYKFNKKGENHLWTPQTISLLQRSVRTSNPDLYKQYAQHINDQSEKLCTIRGLFKFKETTPIALEEVEPVENILKRFVSGAMSFGSISPEAHETIAIAMNRIGGMSNSGEGGEDPARFDTEKSSAIKQIASGRFGVTAEYLANAKELQIKVAQGAKPGEGGQLPGHKIDKVVARIRHSMPGVTLISPPPHHDIYSIEDLAQLIYDLRNSNLDARVSVKLVSEVGVGTVAAGVAKGKADLVLISGHDGGTGASPLTSIKHAGAPWELGLAETHQTLCLNNLRSKIKVQVDGQIKTGRDVIIGALLGAEEFGFATTLLVTLGCVMMRVCHKNSCPVGVATQDPQLRKCFKGEPQHVINFLTYLSEEVREILASLGLKSLDEAVGRSDLLEKNVALDFWKSKNLDFSKIFERVEGTNYAVHSSGLAPREIPEAFDNKLIEIFADSIENKTKKTVDLDLHNYDRSVGTMLSGVIAKKYGSEGLPEDTITVNFKGTAGQSFGSFLSKGITFNIEGETNDFIGKSLSGGKIVIKAPKQATFKASENSIAGNVIAYGATGGSIFINGLAGERFAIRNSGAYIVTEGVGDHCCEYMTGGRVFVLGETGFNFAAGMTGGLAYVYDATSDFDMRCNLQSVDLDTVIAGSEDEAELKQAIEAHYNLTSSEIAKEILDDWSNALPKFVKVFPVEYRKALARLASEEA